jgi:putative ABC transport system ATP-binding protein
MLIKVENLSKSYKSGEVVTKVLHGLSFNIEEGEFAAIMGPSGSGKSTLMHILGMLDRPSGGEYLFLGENVNSLDDNSLASLRNKTIGFVFQAFNLLPRTTVIENVKLPLTYAEGYNSKTMHEKAAAVLESVGLKHRLNYYTNQISGGEKQRVAIARALVNSPKIIFADEPTGNLDSKTGMQIMKILQELNNAGNTVILVTHETFTAEHAKRIIKIIDGRIVSDEKVKKRRAAGDFLK